MSRAIVREVRDARPEEIVALEGLQRRASWIHEEFRDLLTAYPDAIELAPRAVSEHRVRVADGADGAALGFSVVLEVVDGTCELDGLFVEPESMRAGVGRALVDDVVRRARRDGACRLQVTAGPAIAFYERIGFVLGESVRTRFAQARRMELDLFA